MSVASGHNPDAKSPVFDIATVPIAPPSSIMPLEFAFAIGENKVKTADGVGASSLELSATPNAALKE